MHQRPQKNQHAREFLEKLQKPRVRAARYAADIDSAFRIQIPDCCVTREVKVDVEILSYSVHSTFPSENFPSTLLHKYWSTTSTYLYTKVVISMGRGLTFHCQFENSEGDKI